jgi:iron complex outermembrane recepter protein
MTLTTRFLTGAALAALCFPAVSLPTWAQTSQSGNVLETVIVTGERTEDQQPDKIETVTAPEAQTQINVVNTEDMLQDLPSVFVRKRHEGDTQDPVATRTSGVGESARNLIYADGILISTPIGNNNGATGSPHFGIAQPEDVSAIDVLYGPFAAEYGGGSIGAVINITTKMPDQFTLYADVLGTLGNFSLYNTKSTPGGVQLSAGIGDRLGNFSWRASANHLDTFAQPLSLVTLSQPATASSAGTVVTGGIPGLARTGTPIDIIGAGDIEHQVEDTDTLKVAYDFDNGWEASYTVSLFHQIDNSTTQTYLATSAGAAVYTGNVNSGGYNYNIAASTFDANLYNWEQTHLAQGLSLKSGTDGEFQWEIVGSDYAYLVDNEHIPTTALPGALSTTTPGAGTNTSMDGSGWYTIDAKGVWKGWTDNQLSFGLHRDQEVLSQIKNNTANWMSVTPASVATDAKGRTATNAIWAQDIWSILPDLKATLGLRGEQWNAYSGYNFSASPALNVNQPKLHTSDVSPKASLAWQVADPWTVTASYGEAFRMPTVTELYQAITTGTQLTVPNPNLKPERANSYELAAEYKTDASRLRLSLFREDIANALLSQSAPLVAGSTTLYSYVQNVDRTRAQGVELVGEQKDALIDGLDLSGSITYVNARTVKDTAFPSAAGQALPQLPKLRAEAVATYRVTDDLSLSLSGHYSDRSYGTINQSDPVSTTFTGFSESMTLDARARYQIDDNWSVAAGVDNLTDDIYWEYHPFPQRTFVMEIHYAQ